MHMNTAEIIEFLRSKEASKRCLGLKLAGRQLEYAALPLASRALVADNDPEVRALAAWTLDQLGSPVTVPALIEALYDPDFNVRSNAGWALVHMAERMIPQVVVPDVVDVMRDRNSSNARQMAYLVLNHIGNESARDAIRRYWHG